MSEDVSDETPKWTLDKRDKEAIKKEKEILEGIFEIADYFAGGNFDFSGRAVEDFMTNEGGRDYCIHRCRMESHQDFFIEFVRLRETDELVAMEIRHKDYSSPRLVMAPPETYITIPGG